MSKKFEKRSKIEFVRVKNVLSASEGAIRSKMAQNFENFDNYEKIFFDLRNFDGS